MSEWPKRTTIYLRGDKDSNWQTGLQLGLSEAAISHNFRYCLYEISVEIEVNEDGTYRVIEFLE